MQGWRADIKEWEMSGIRVHDVKFPNNQQNSVLGKIKRMDTFGTVPSSSKPPSFIAFYLGYNSVPGV